MALGPVSGSACWVSALSWKGSVGYGSGCQSRVPQNAGNKYPSSSLGNS